MVDECHSRQPVAPVRAEKEMPVVPVGVVEQAVEDARVRQQPGDRYAPVGRRHQLQLLGVGQPVDEGALLVVHVLMVLVLVLVVLVTGAVAVLLALHRQVNATAPVGHLEASRGRGWREGGKREGESAGVNTGSW